MNANLIETARRSILSAGIQSEDYPGIGLFVSHHIDELSADYWMNQTGTAKPSADAILNLLQAMEIDDEEADLDEEGEMVIDFTLPGEATQYLLSVTLDSDGQVSDIDMES